MQTSQRIDPDTDVLIIVDIQNDFCPGGSLAVSDGDTIIPLINELEKSFTMHVLTRDWHPADHHSFSKEPTFVDKSWPAHCVAGTRGAEFHTDLVVPDGAHIVSKGTDSTREAYSGFQGTELADFLRRLGVQRLFVCGLATDYCVKNTVLDGIKEGFHVSCILDCCRGVNIPEGTVEQAIDEMRTAGALLVESKTLSR